VTSVGEKEEKTNTIEPPTPLLVVFSHSEYDKVYNLKLSSEPNAMDNSKRDTHTHTEREREREERRKAIIQVPSTIQK